MANVYPLSRSAMPAKCEVRAKADAGEVVIYGVIGGMYDGVTARELKSELRKLSGIKTLDIYINSPGGYVTDGRAIFNSLKAFQARKKTVYVDGEASSIASLIAMAGDEIRMREGALMLVHRAWGLTVGNADDHARVIVDLETMDRALVETYCARTKMKPDECMALMREDRYMDAAEAVALGFADVAESGTKMAALATVDREALHLPALPTPSRSQATAAISRIRAALAR